jgi:hypothetical protein
MAKDYLALIQRGALQRGLDPAAVAAVASTEGGFGGPSSAPGDGGTSFGPFQLHIGGALPAAVASRGPDYAQQWAWSNQGINYALDRIRSVAANKGGASAVQAIVVGFERPKDPSAEITKALSRYSSFQGGSAVPREKGSAADAGSYDAGTAASDAYSASGLKSVVSLGQFLGRLTDPKYILRGLQIVAGGAMVLVGVTLLVRQVGLPTAYEPAPDLSNKAKREFAQVPGGEDASIAQAAEGMDTRPAKREDLRPKPVYSTRKRNEGLSQTSEIPF